MNRREFFRFAGLSGVGLGLALFLPDFITRRVIRAVFEFDTCVPFVDDEWHHVRTTWTAPNEIHEIWIDDDLVTGDESELAAFFEEGLTFRFNEDLTEWSVGFLHGPEKGSFFYTDEFSQHYYGWESGNHHRPITVTKDDGDWIAA